jgi:oligoendopeptidase F
MIRTALLLLATAQGPSFDPFPGGIASRYQFDLSKNFFATPEAERVARERLVAGAEAIGRARDSLTDALQSSPEAFDRVLFRVDSLARLAGKHYAYLSLRGILDSRDSAAGTAMQALGRNLGNSLAFVNAAVGQIPEDTIERWARANPAVARWRYAARQARAGGPRPVNRSVVDSLTGWQAGAFMGILRGYDFGTVTTPEGDLDIRTQGARLMNHPDRAVRAQWYRQNKATLAQDSFAVLLSAIVRGNNAVARLRGFTDYREESYGARDLTVRGVAELLERIAAASDVHRRYERMRNAHLQAAWQLDTVRYWDLVLPEPGMAVPQFTILEASQIIRRSLAVLGPEYGAELAALLDPSNGRMDLIPRPFRAERQGFSTGSVGYPSTFFQGRFSGYLDDVIVFAHEGGHSVQNMLMEASRVLATYSGGPGYFTESFAGLNELLLTDHLARTSGTPAERIYYRQRFLDYATEIFKTGREALFEHELYALPDAEWTAGELEARMQRTGARFSIWFGPGSDRTMEWVNAIHFYTRPLYRVNYVYSKLLALSYFAKLEEDRGFAGRFMRLLSNGYDASPEDLLRRLVGLSLDPEALVHNARNVIAAGLAELETLYP